MKIKTHYLKKMLTWLLPHSCIFCGEFCTINDLCNNCQTDFPLFLNGCATCGKSLNNDSPILTCGCCLNNAPPFDRTYTLYYYQPPVSKLIVNLKFGESLVNAEILGKLLADKIQTTWYKFKPLPDVIIPIPLHPHRLRERGFNQSLEIARPVAKLLNIPLEWKNCHRIKSTAAQATLPAKERLQNIKQAFHITGNLCYQHVAILDDVITTGHTVTEFATALKSAGVGIIDVWSCARPSLS